MRIEHVFDYPDIQEFDFKDRPKGDLLKLSVNPYSGKVLVGVSNFESSGAVALDVMRKLVRACDVLERNGSLDPLRDLIGCPGSVDFGSLDRAEIRNVVDLMGRGEDGRLAGGSEKAAGCGAKVKKAS